MQAVKMDGNVKEHAQTVLMRKIASRHIVNHYNAAVGLKL